MSTPSSSTMESDTVYLNEDEDDNLGLVWKPIAGFRDAKLLVYLANAKTRKIERLALTILMANEYKAVKSIKDLQNCKAEHRPQPWNVREQFKFHKLFLTHGKKFDEIRKHFPKKDFGRGNHVLPKLETETLVFQVAFNKS